MILFRYGKNIQSVKTNFDSRALTEIKFIRDQEVSMLADDFFQTHEKISEHSLTAQSEGSIQDEVESIMLNDLLEQLLILQNSLDEGEVIFIESEKGKNYPKTNTRQKNIVLNGDNRFHFYSNIDPPLKLGVYREL
jgi:hypothetical protein